MRAELSSRVKGAEGACPLLARRAGASRPPGSPLCVLWSGPLLPAPTSRAEGSLQLGSHRVLPWWFLDSDPSAWAASDRGDTGDTLTSRREWSPAQPGLTPLTGRQRGADRWAQAGAWCHAEYAGGCSGLVPAPGIPGSGAVVGEEAQRSGWRSQQLGGRKGDPEEGKLGASWITRGRCGPGMEGLRLREVSG